jgi:hypothetical protein
LTLYTPNRAIDRNTLFLGKGRFVGGPAAFLMVPEGVQGEVVARRIDPAQQFVKLGLVSPQIGRGIDDLVSVLGFVSAKKIEGLERDITSPV